jgi:bacillithiol system protein YtxJ
MGFFNTLFGGSSDPESERQLAWIPLNRTSQLDEILERSHTKVQIIFKHSTRCGISNMALRQFQSVFSQNALDADLYYLDLIAFRSISNSVVEKFQVYHQSPQVIIIKNGEVVAHESHGAINGLNFSRFS